MWLANRAGEHPQAAILQFDHHVLVELPTRELQTAALLPRRTFIGRFKHAARLLMPIGHRQQPGAIFEHRRLVQRATFRKHHRCAPHRIRRIGIIAAHEPVRDALLRIAELLIEKQPQTPLRIGPQIPHQRPADLLRRLHPRPDCQTRLRPRRAIVIARRQQKIPIPLVPRPRPATPDAPLRRAIHSDDHRSTACAVLKLRAGSHHHRGRQSILISNLRPIREHQQHHLLELKPFTCLHRPVVKAHAIHLPRKKLHFRAIDLQEARLSQRLLLTRRFGSSRRSQRKQRAGLGDGHVELFDAGAVKRQVFDRIGHFVDDIVAVGEESHAAFHDGGRGWRRCGPFDSLMVFLRFELAHAFQFAEHDAVGRAAVVALADGEPERAFVFVEGRILEGMRGLEAVFALPGFAIAGDVHVEDAAIAVLDLGVLLPAEVIDAAELIEGRFGVQAVGREGLRLGGGPGFAVLAGGEVVVARVVAHDGHPGAVGQAVHGGFAELLRLRLVVVADDFEGDEVILQHGEGVLFAGEVVERDVASAIELLERIEDVEAVVHGGPFEALGSCISMEMTWLHVEGAGCGLEFGFVDAVFEALGAQIEVAIPRQLARRLAAKVGAQRVLVLADDARHESLRLWQRDVGECLARFGKQVRFFHTECLQVHHRQHTIHRRTRSVTG